MIGHLVNILTPEEEDILLTRKLGHFVDGDCLLQCLTGTMGAMDKPGSRHHREWKHAIYSAITLQEKYAGQGLWRKQPCYYWHSVGARYDMLVARFGVVVVARAIRNRVLSNQARRLLKQGSKALV